MKKIYISPAIRTIDLKNDIAQSIIVGSNTPESTAELDKNEILIMESRDNNSIWDNEW